MPNFLYVCSVHCDKQEERQEGGIEPLHVSMPHELKSCPSTSPTHPGRSVLHTNRVMQVVNILGLTFVRIVGMAFPSPNTFRCIGRILATTNLQYGVYSESH